MIGFYFKYLIYFALFRVHGGAGWLVCGCGVWLCLWATQLLVMICVPGVGTLYDVA